MLQRAAQPGAEGAQASEGAEGARARRRLAWGSLGQAVLPLCAELVLCVARPALRHMTWNASDVVHAPTALLLSSCAGMCDMQLLSVTGGWKALSRWCSGNVHGCSSRAQTDCAWAASPLLVLFD